jgi:UDP-glucose 4-epimerase
MTGGTGYIGSHTVLELVKRNHQVVVVDNLSNSSYESLNRVKELTGKEVTFYKLDLMDREKLQKVFIEESPEYVIHFAGLKAVGESVQLPLKYYHNNITGTLNLLDVMKANGVKNIVFSSSATVYGDPKEVPIKEDFPLKAASPYGRTKLMIEEILRDVFVSDNEWNIAVLRYFNPVGSHESGLIGEDPNGIPNNLMPIIAHVAVGRRDQVLVFGKDYPTSDGTGVRDYIHVVDLAIGHIKAIEKLDHNPGIIFYNLGTGIGYSVLEVIHAFEKASGKAIKYKFVDRRPGDVAQCYADPILAMKELQWKSERDLNDMCRDVWRWQSQNPQGYKQE